MIGRLIRDLNYMDETNDPEKTASISESHLSESDLSTTTRVLEQLLSDQPLYESKSCRRLRKAISQLFDLQKSRMYGGMSQSEYDQDREKKKRAVVDLQQKRLEDRKYIEKTVLRAGRMRALRSLLSQDGASGAPLILDGVAEEDQSMTMMTMAGTTHSEELQRMLGDKNDEGNEDGNKQEENGGKNSGMIMTNDTDHHESSSSSSSSAASAAPELNVNTEKNVSNSNEISSSSSSSSSSSTTGETTKAHLQIARACYACKKRFRELHHFYDLLCPSCAELNYKKRLQTVDLSGRVALVTGARVKIGFQCCLKLLRCGAAVIATSRFPRDASERFAAQPDVSSWSHRLHVFGLDLRDLASVEAFCAMVLRDYARLDIIINNACQTIRRPPAYYAPLMDSERILPEQGSVPRLLLERNAAHHLEKTRWIASGPSSSLSSSSSSVSAVDSYQSLPLTNGPSTDTASFASSSSSGVGTSSIMALSSSSLSSDIGTSNISSLSSAELSQLAMIPGDSLIDPAAFPDGLKDVNKQQVDLRTSNSWLLRAHEVSTPEIVEVMAINAISPFILNARLKSLMEKSAPIVSTVIRATPPSRDASSSSSSSLAISHNHIVGHSSLSSMSLAESILSSFSPDNIQAAGRAFTRISGGGSSKNGTGSRGHPIGGANKRPRRETGGGSGLEGDKAEHGVPASLCKFIVNVSSMEGKFYRAKTPSHPHTNMAKSSLNQLTRTSAGDYAESHIYMNAVDTGWINDENPLIISARTAARHGFATPLDEVDAAARILDPIIAPLLEAQESGICMPVYGAFLKDFAETEW